MISPIDSVMPSLQGYGLDNLPMNDNNNVKQQQYNPSMQQQNLFLNVPNMQPALQPALQPYLCGNCESANASTRCLQCDEDCAFLCHDCAGKHNQMKAFRRHEIVLLSDYVMMTNNYHQNNRVMINHQHVLKLDNPYQQYDPSLSLNPPSHSPIRNNESLLMPDITDKTTMGFFDCSYEQFTLIMRDGHLISKIMNQTGCDVFPTQHNAMMNDGNPKQLAIRGLHEQVEMAKQILKDFLDLHTHNELQNFTRQAISSSMNSSPAAVQQLPPRQRGPPRLITVSKEHTEMLLRGNGAVILDVMKKSNTQLAIKNDALSKADIDNGVTCIEIAGNRQEIEMAIGLIQRVIDHGPGGLLGVHQINNAAPLPALVPPASAAPVSKFDSLFNFESGGMSPWNESPSNLFTMGTSGSPPSLVGSVPMPSLVSLTGSYQSTLASESSHETIMYMDCPHDKVKLVIGAKGVIIKNIMKRSKTVIIIDEKFPEGHPRKVEIRGKLEHIKVAQGMIASVIEHGPTSIDSSDIDGAGDKSFGGKSGLSGSPLSMIAGGKSRSPESISELVAIRCPADKISIVIGAKGVIINEISRRSNAQISIDEDPRNSIAETAKALLGGDVASSSPPEGSENESTLDLRRIEIRGTPEEIEAARSLIESVVANGPNVLYIAGEGPAGADGSRVPAKKSFEIACPKDKVGALIGSRGVIIKEVMRKSNTQISVAEEVIQHPFVDGVLVEARMVTIRGYPEDIDVCTAIIEEIIGSEYLPDPARSPRAADYAAALQSAPSTPGDASPAPKLPSSFPSWGGPADALETLTVPLDRMRDIIGIKGTVIKKISSQSGAKIIVNNDLPAGVPRILELRGTSDQVSGARRMLSTILDSPALRAAKVDVDGSPKIGDLDDSFYRDYQDIKVDGTGSPTRSAAQYVELLSPSAAVIIAAKKPLLEKIISLAGVTIVTSNTDSRNNTDSSGNHVYARICIDGAYDNVADAVGLVYRLFHDAISNEKRSASSVVRQDEPLVCEALDWPLAKVHVLSGPRGSAALKEIMRRSGASATLLKSRHLSSPAAPWRRLAIIGAAAAVLKAKTLLATLMQRQHEDSSPGHRDDDDYPEDSDCGDEYWRVRPYEAELSSDGEDELGEDVSSAHCSIECPDDKVGLVIGFRGVVIKSMMKRSRAKIVVVGATVNGKSSRIVEIRGTEAQVEAAKKMVECVITLGADALDVSGDTSMALGIITRSVELTGDNIKAMSAVLGAGLKSVMQRTMATISILQPKKSDDASVRRLTVKGTISYVNSAMAIIQETMAQLNIKPLKARSRADDEGDARFDEAPRSSAARPTASPGASPSSTLKQSPAEEDDEEDEGESDSFIQKSSKSNRSTTRTVRCPVLRVGTLIGTRGIIVKEVMKRTGATIVVSDAAMPDPEDPAQEVREVLIRGSRAAVLAAEKLVRQLIEHGTKVLTKGGEKPH